jgi:hypothetical protein
MMGVRDCRTGAPQRILDVLTEALRLSVAESATCSG